MTTNWTANNETWKTLTPAQKAAAMSLMEAGNISDAKNALGAMINRSDKEGVDLGTHVSGKIYQPTIEPSQEARLNVILKKPEFKQLTDVAEQRMSGLTPDWANGATHFLAKPSTMLNLESKNPDKYKNWGPRGANWSGYDEKTGKYGNQVMEDNSHAFLTPEGVHSAQFGDAASVPPGVTPTPVATTKEQPPADGVPSPIASDAFDATKTTTAESAFEDLKSHIDEQKAAAAPSPQAVASAAGPALVGPGGPAGAATGALAAAPAASPGVNPYLMAQALQPQATTPAQPQNALAAFANPAAADSSNTQNMLRLMAMGRDKNNMLASLRGNGVIS
jgi:hypothetical protein